MSVCVSALTTIENLLETSSPKEGAVGKEETRGLTPVGYSGPDASNSLRAGILHPEEAEVASKDWVNAFQRQYTYSNRRISIFSERKVGD